MVNSIPLTVVCPYYPLAPHTPTKSQQFETLVLFVKGKMHTHF